MPAGGGGDSGRERWVVGGTWKSSFGPSLAQFCKVAAAAAAAAVAGDMCWSSSGTDFEASEENPPWCSQSQVYLGWQAFSG